MQGSSLSPAPIGYAPRKLNTILLREKVNCLRLHFKKWSFVLQFYCLVLCCFISNFEYDIVILLPFVILFNLLVVFYDYNYWFVDSYDYNYWFVIFWLYLKNTWTYTYTKNERKFPVFVISHWTEQQQAFFHTREIPEFITFAQCPPFYWVTRWNWRNAFNKLFEFKVYSLPSLW